jgi:hypothetical protein
MKILIHPYRVSDKYYLFKCLLIMKLTLFFILIFNIGAFADVYSQTKISLNYKDADLTKVLSEIEHNSSYHFTYSNSNIAVNKKVTIVANDANVIDVLNKIFGDLNLSYVETGNHLISIAPLNKIADQQAAAERITG